MRHLLIALRGFLLIIAIFFHKTCNVVAVGQDGSKDSNAEPPLPTTETDDSITSAGFTDVPVSQSNENLALTPDDLPALPFLPSLSGSENMNYGPNPLEEIIRDISHPPFDAKSQRKPECKKREIPWRGGGPFPMFAFCCLQGPPRPTGPRVNQENPRLPYRRRRCYVCTFQIRSYCTLFFC